MNACVFCSRQLNTPLSIHTIFSVKAIKTPISCHSCKNKFQKIDSKTACPGCSRQQTHPDLCADCVKWKIYGPAIEPSHQAIFVYNDIARQYMSDFKFQGDVLLARLWGEEIYKLLKPYTKTHILTVIPTSSNSFQKRGFNQVELLLKYANIPYNRLIKQVINTKKQSSQNRQDRLKSAQPFELISPQEYELIKKPVLIIDDVYTTGRTIFHARELLETSILTASISLFR